MFRLRSLVFPCLAAVTVTLALTAPVHAQTFGAELNNTLMPASGGMAGVSLSRPQDSGSALNGNTATLTQFSGMQIMIGAAWAEATYKASYDGSVPALSCLVSVPLMPSRTRKDHWRRTLP